ncbi:MAG: hypothetical protein DME93_06730 [Verrucomicrobia bacterium]|nr:MAG: hypothetical protein DME93_06730 [Verrucomicrobiota bacterium]
MRNGFSTPKISELQAGGIFRKMMRSVTETGYVADAHTRTNRVQHDDAIDACAVFIKHELEDIRRA